jgi:RimJ/RimL family protein N-acetyltransferase
MCDAHLLHAWRNDPETRRASRQGGLVPWEDHLAWLSAVLASPDRVIRIAELAGEPVGVVRADRSADGWELSWTVAPEARSRGIGSNMLKLFAADLDGRLVAAIRHDNPASARIAAAAGLIRVASADDQDFEHWASR